MRKQRVNRRIASELQRKIATLLKTEFDDPVFDWIAIHEVFLTPDRQTAYIIFDVFGETRVVQKAQRALQGVAGLIAEAIGRSMRLRHVPKLVFLYEHDPETIRVRMKYA